MRLLSSTDYALRCLIWLGRHPDLPQTSEEIAEGLRISRNHLQKVIQSLADGGFVNTRRGPRGGVTLAKSQDDISVGAVIRWLELGQALVDCFRPDGGDCSLKPDCRLQHALGAAEQAFLAHLDQVRLVDLVGASS